MLQIFIIFFSVCCFVYWWTYKNNSSCDEPKSVPWTLYKCLKAFLGTELDLWGKVMFMSQLSKEFGGVSYMYAGLRKVYVVTNPEDGDTVLKSCLERDVIYDQQYGAWLGHGFLIASNKAAKIRRKHIATALTQRRMDEYMIDFNEHARRFVNDFASNVDAGPRDLCFCLAEYNLNLMCSTVFGLKTLGKVNWLPYWQARKLYLKARSAKLMHVFYHYNIMYGSSQLKKKEDEALEILHRTSSQIISEEPTLYEEKPVDSYRKTVIQAVDEGVLRPDEIRAIFDNAIFATHDTTSYSTMYTLVLIGSDQRVQDKVYQEIQKVMSEKETDDLTNKDLSKMEYLDAVILESIRMYPFIPLQARKIDKKLKLSNCTLSANTGCWVLVYSSHRHSSWGADAEEFRPERWLDGSPTPPMFGFGQGLRNCIGRRYGMVSMKTLLALLLMRYRFRANYKEMKIDYIGILEPKSGHLVSTERR